jgi:hypothetical protein
MEPSEALSTAAQIAVALAGFAGVVVGFRSGPLHEWSLLDKYRLWLLLANAVVPLFSCLLGILLLTIRPTPPSIWRWCSWCSFVFIFLFSTLSWRQQVHRAPNLIKEVGSYRYLFYLLGLLGMIVGLLQAYNALVFGVFWLFYTAIVFQLVVGVLQFARMILLPPHTSKI